ncbi:thermonuclease family protein [Cyanobium sp. Morenito 9A2]|nr:thermonuclease family protein [Cyanobium sp. Morenito 9A2]
MVLPLLLTPRRASAVTPIPALPTPARFPTADTDPQPVTYSGIVLKVENGQVLRVRIGNQERRVRLACVQAPRPAQEPWSWQASEALQRSVPLGSPVEIDLRARDVFGRLVAVVRLNGRDVASPSLRQGVLFAYDGYLGQCGDLAYPRLEGEARQWKRGVWSVEGGIERPWNLLARQASVEEP